MGDIAEQTNDLLNASSWYEKSLSNNPDYKEAKSRLEHIDSLMHIDTGGKGGMEQPEMSKQEEGQKKDETVIQEGQIKKVAFYKSKIKFDGVIGLTR